MTSVENGSRQQTTADIYQRQVMGRADSVIWRALAKLGTGNAPRSIDTFLDIGSGSGHATAFLRPVLMPKKIIGTDVSPAAVTEFQQVNAGATGLVHDINESPLPLDDGEVDVVLCTEVIEHVYNPDFLASEIHRVLRPGGGLLISTPNLASWANRLLLLAGIQPLYSEVSTERVFGRPGRGDVVGHLRLYTLRALTQFLEYHGFSIIATRGTAFNALREMNLATRWADDLFTRFPSCASGFALYAEPRNTDT